LPGARARLPPEVLLQRLGLAYDQRQTLLTGGSSERPLILSASLSRGQDERHE
jgi:hypothetical protein